MRRTKIICTLGPACTDEVLRGLLRGGMDTARFNFSHGDHHSQLEMLTRFRAACADCGAAVPTMLDTRGPEVRVCGIPPEGLPLAEGSMVRVCPDDASVRPGGFRVTYPLLATKLTAGDGILLDDGQIELRVERTDGADLLCAVLVGGVLKNNKSINVPGRTLGLPYLNERDRADLRFGVEQGFDCVAASFVRRPEDLEELRGFLRSLGRELPLIAKLENREGVRNMESIIAASDGVMAARGDLGVEIPAARVPALQKRMTSTALALGKPIIIATQMLDSMSRNPRPTRAEVSDVAQAVFDMADCVMLSGETAAGKYPLKSLTAMAEILCEAERAMDHWTAALHPQVMTRARICQLYKRERKVYDTSRGT